jgi:hypothetical protein
MSIGVAVVIALATAFGVWQAVQRFDRTGADQKWRAALRDLQASHGFTTHGHSLEAPLPNGVIRIEDLAPLATAMRDASAHTRLVVELDSPHPLHGLTLELKRPSVGSKNDVQLGDADFDTKVHILGDLGLALTLIGDDNRAFILDAIRDGWTFSSKRSAGWYLVAPPPSLEALLAAIERGRRLATITDNAFDNAVTRLAHAAAHGPTPTIRAAALKPLATYFADTTEAAAALDRGTYDASPEVRLIVAIERKNGTSLAAITRHDAATSDHKRRAFDVLLGEPDSDATHAMLAYHCTRPTELSALAVTALERSRHPDAEQLWCAAMNEPHDQTTQLAAIRSLHQHGTTASIAALSPLADRVLTFGRTVELHLAAKEAVASIRLRRDPTATAGSLALVDAQGGELSVLDPPGS